MQIDAVITWVDSSDEVWRNKINQHLDKKIDWSNKKESTRYNSINEIEICILSILKFATYIKNIYVVTDNQQPQNFLELKKKANDLDVNLELVDHKVIFRGYEEYLPTFNSQSIETMLYKIPNLSEYFVYFNDDVFLINKTSQEDFFQRGYPVLRGGWGKFKKDIWYKKIGKLVKKQTKVSHVEAIDKSAGFIGFSKKYKFHHTPHPLRKSSFESFFKQNTEVKRANIKFKFRNVNQYVPHGLINHYEIKHKTCVIDNNLSLCYIQSYNSFKVKKKIFKVDMKKEKVLFMCLQSLETAPQKTLNYILNWVDKRLESNFANDI